MRIGSLFSGIGGLELGLENAGVGHTVWHVEQDPFCQHILREHWGEGPQLFDDVRAVGAHNLEPVDVICGGFPCQDISVAGNGAGLAGERSGLWFEFARIIREMGPRYVVVENVAALTNRGLDRVLGTLADSGYDAEWSCLQAIDVGAPHYRDRVFLIAYAVSNAVRLEPERGQPHAPERGHAVARDDGAAEYVPDPDGGRFVRGGLAESTGVEGARGRVSDGLCEVREQHDSASSCVADADAGGCEESRQSAPSWGSRPEFADARRRGENLAHAAGERIQGVRSGREQVANPYARAGLSLRDGGGGGVGESAADVPDADGAGLGDIREREAREALGGGDGWRHAAGDRGLARGSAAWWWTAEPDVGRVAHGVPARVDRLKALGNAVVPQVAEVVGHRLMQIHEEILAGVR